MVIIGLIAALVGLRFFPKLCKGKHSAAKARFFFLRSSFYLPLSYNINLIDSTLNPKY